MIVVPPAAQFGALAACIVLFVPMAMAGWHLSRNKVLFFSGALFIALAVGVHLAPYFPSIFVLSNPSSFIANTKPTFSCIQFLHDLNWDISSPAPAEISWRWTPSPSVLSCGIQKLRRSDVSELLNGSWVLVAGDSQARLFTLALLRLILDLESMAVVEAELFRRHSDYHAAIHELGITVDFVWAPFESNLTTVVRGLESAPNLPDVIVLGSGLWHMLHFTNSTEYGEGLDSVKRAAVGLGSRVLVQQPHMFWLGLPALVNSMLNTEVKRERMNVTMWEKYDREAEKCAISRSLGGPFLVLDVGLLSRGCGVQCTVDGMHYDGVVYEAALHVMLNALLIESQQHI